MKNEALLKKTDAADQWAYYQAVSTKSHLMELAMTLVEESKQPPFKDKIAKYEQQKEEVQAKANQLEAASTKANDESTALGIPRERLMYALALPADRDQHRLGHDPHRPTLALCRGADQQRRRLGQRRGFALLAH